MQLLGRRTFFDTKPNPLYILIRIMTGTIFLSEGIQKFLYPDWLGSGRFEGMGFLAPEFFVGFVGSFEIVSGILLLIGLATYAAALVMLMLFSSPNYP